MFKANFIPMGLSPEAQHERTSIYMACRKLMKKEIRTEMRKAQEEEYKKKKKNQVRTAFVSKKSRESIKEESEEDKPISESSHESANY